MPEHRLAASHADQSHKEIDMTTESKMAAAFATIIEGVGEDLERDGLRDTPQRAAKAFNFLTQGYGQSVEGIVNNALFTSECSEMVVVNDIELYSMCEHHMLPFIGRAHVAYIPHGKVLGLSKVARIVDMFARRLQIQETLTVQVAETIQNVTGAAGVGVIIEAKHLCMMMRGVEKQNSVMRTSAMLGTFRSDASTRSEFLALVGHNNN
jgi:GTP cyclohydrolase I